MSREAWIPDGIMSRVWASLIAVFQGDIAPRIRRMEGEVLTFSDSNIFPRDLSGDVPPIRGRA